MYSLPEILAELAALGTEITRKTHLRHGAVEPLFGVRIGDMKPLLKKLKGQQQLALELYASRNSDAMYLAGMIADGAKMTENQLQDWANGATWHMLAGTIVPWVAAENSAGWKLAEQWILSPKELLSTAGWATLAAMVSTLADDKLHLARAESLLEHCQNNLHQAGNRTRYVMNSYIIAVGTYVAPLAEKALTVARAIGNVEVDFADTACQVPDADSYIFKARKGEPVAKKRKTIRC